MREKTKKRILNIAMVVAIVIMAVVAIAIIGKHKGWFDKDERSGAEDTAIEIIASDTDGQVEVATDSEAEEEIYNQAAIEYLDVTESYVEEDTRADITESDDSNSARENETSPVENESTTTEVTTELDTTESFAIEGNTEFSTTESPATEATTERPEVESKSCTITIQCTSILDNMDKLKEGKESYVPSSGYILSTTMTYTDGETVFDVLTRACSSYGIQIEYAYTPMYGTYYIEGINQLYEFDCGGTSGWKYSVNGTSPNVGCSDYIVNENDSIVWYYYCE